MIRGDGLRGGVQLAKLSNIGGRGWNPRLAASERVFTAENDNFDFRIHGYGE